MDMRVLNCGLPNWSRDKESIFFPPTKAIVPNEVCSVVVVAPIRIAVVPVPVEV
jgi:hypothetical protein